MLYRLTITIPVPSVFRHEFQSAVSNFPSWCATVFGRRRYFDGAVPRISCMLIMKICCCIAPLWIHEDAVMEWLHADGNVTTVHHYTVSEIVHILVSPEKNDSEEESSDENEGVRERISIDRLIKNCSNFL